MDPYMQHTCCTIFRVEKEAAAWLSIWFAVIWCIYLHRNRNVFKNDQLDFGKLNE
ncbi:hypothetical protein Lalb_Chr05g0225451 [Lupinus albus]|uniref:Uncharacterized protein n=1 Tax=Lupinus albus TaxID=3870 RepID=A0A6A4QJS5_LUPAL|nr:hypothetical protein Lalb_Chr05g0225451 [Lupinus albus]